MISGYTGGSSQNPTYDDHDGHYETVKITYDDTKISYAHIVDKFLHSTDIVDADGQFCDRGKAFRSAIFVSNNAEKQIAKDEIAKAQTALARMSSPQF